MANAYLEAINKARLDGVQIGIDIGMQMACDMISLSLRDPAVMGKDTFSAKRLEPVMQDALKKRGLYAPAWGGGPEADYYQEKMDANLKEAYAGRFEPFFQRYPYCKENRYLPRHYKGRMKP